MLKGILSFLAAGADGDATGGSESSSSGVEGEVGDGVPGSFDAESVARRIAPVVDRAVDDEETRAALNAAIRTELETIESERASPDLTAGADGRSIPIDEFVEAFPQGVYVIDADHTVLAYNSVAKRGIGLDPDHTEFLGTDGRETFSAATYGDGSREYTLPDKVAENPHDADEAWDVRDLSDVFPTGDVPVYGDRSVIADGDGGERHIDFTAVPLFSDDGDLQMVVEVINDRTEERNRQESVEALVATVTDTVRAIGRGDLDARAEYRDDRDAIDPELLDLVTEVNEMAADFQGLIERVDERATNLAASIERATESAYWIDEQLTEQNQSFEVVAEEMEDFSATMQEVAASAKEVADAAEEAQAEADRGVEAGEDARTATDEVRQRSETLVETVEALDAYMDEIGEVADVISEVADQTDLLALNANIEAARAGDSGKGFAVVADEVKKLATETQEHTGEIATLIESIQEQTGETVEEVEAAHERIEAVDGEIAAALDSMGSISEKIGTAASGIQDVADANDEQAVTVEEVTATIEGAREYAARVSETVEDVVEEAQKQERAVTELATSVNELSSDGAGGEAVEDGDEVVDDTDPLWGD